MVRKLLISLLKKTTARVPKKVFRISGLDVPRGAAKSLI